MRDDVMPAVYYHWATVSAAERNWVTSPGPAVGVCGRLLVAGSSSHWPVVWRRPTEGPVAVHTELLVNSCQLVVGKTLTRCHQEMY